MKGLVLDFGGVLSLDQDSACRQRMASCLEVPVDRLHRTYWEHRPYYDSGAAAADYWKRVLDALGAPDKHAHIPYLIQEDVISWTQYRDDIWDMTLRFRKAGGRTAFLSNNVPELMRRIRADRTLDTWFDVVVASCEVRLAKPDPRIYELCLEQLELPPAACLFVDDKEVNVAAARDVGMQAILFHGTRAEVERLPGYLNFK